MLNLTIKEAELVRGLCTQGRVSVSDSDLMKVASLLPRQMLKEAKGKLPVITSQNIADAKNTISNMGKKFLNLLGNKAPSQISNSAYNSARDRAISEAKANQGWFRSLLGLGPDAKTQAQIDFAARKFGLTPSQLADKQRSYGALAKKWKETGRLSQDEMASFRNLGKDLQITKARNYGYAEPTEQSISNVSNVLNSIGRDTNQVGNLTTELNTMRGANRKAKDKIKDLNRIISNQNTTLQNTNKAHADEVAQLRQQINDATATGDRRLNDYIAQQNAAEKDRLIQELQGRRWYQDPVAAASLGVGGTLAGIGGLNAMGNIAGSVFGNRGYDDRRGRGPVIIS